VAAVEEEHLTLVPERRLLIEIEHAVRL